MSKQKNKRKAHKRKTEKVEIKHSRIQLYFTAFSLILSVVSMVISIKSASDTQSLEYKKNLPNLNMSIDVQMNEETGTDVLSYQIFNDGGVIREARITPHMYISYLSIPDLGADFERYCAIEIMDFFAPHWGNGIYYSATIPYNAIEKSWFFEIERSRIAKGEELLNLVGLPYWEIDGILYCLTLCLEVEYTDVTGESHTEWYKTASDLFYTMEDAYSYSTSLQLTSIDDDSTIPLSVFQYANGINMDEIMKDGEAEYDTELIAMVSQYCVEQLFGNENNN